MAIDKNKKRVSGRAKSRANEGVKSLKPKVVKEKKKFVGDKRSGVGRRKRVETPEQAKAKKKSQALKDKYQKQQLDLLKAPEKKTGEGTKIQGPKTKKDQAAKDKEDLAAYRKRRAEGSKNKKEVKSGVSKEKKDALDKKYADTGDKELATYLKKRRGDKKKPTSKVSAKDAYRAKMKKANEGGITSGGEKRRAARKAKRAERTENIQKKGMKYKVGDKKGERLLKRAKRRRDRDAGRRKSAVGTALTKVGRGVFGGLAALGGSDAALRKAGSKGSFYKRKAHEKKKK